MDPFFWDNGKMVDIGTLGGTYGFPNAMNSRGQVIGQSNVAGASSPPFHPFLWIQGALQDLRTLGGNYGAANGINDFGQVVGCATSPGDSASHPVFWQHGVIHDLGLLSGYDYGFGNSVNLQGQIVGNEAVFG